LLILFARATITTIHRIRPAIPTAATGSGGGKLESEAPHFSQKLVAPRTGLPQCAQ
jgi:hypothetical protein